MTLRFSTLALAAAFAVFPVKTMPVHADEPDAKLLETFVSEFVAITPGKGRYPKSFKMGDNSNPGTSPAHEVTFEYDFAIAKYEVPQNLYETVTGENPSRWKGPRNSVEMMTRAEAVDFCERITAALHAAKLIDEDEQIRLPTEAEWEYCCRAGTTTKYSFGDEARRPTDEGNAASILDDYAWHTGNAAGNDPPVGALKPNPWGLYDVHGYLSEFVQDDYSGNYVHVPSDGSAAPWKGKGDPGATVRGGSWKDRYFSLTSASRRLVPMKTKDDAIGFRCVKVRARRADASSGNP